MSDFTVKLTDQFSSRYENLIFHAFSKKRITCWRNNRLPFFKKKWFIRNWRTDTIEVIYKYITCHKAYRVIKIAVNYLYRTYRPPNNYSVMKKW